MKNYKLVLFFVFVILYATGLLVGSLSQVGAENQAEMYEYLEGAVSGYNVSVPESIKQILEDNLKLFVILVAGGIFVVGPVIMGVVMIIKGYFAGFAITAMLRLLGIRGLLFCLANLLSAAIIVPAFSWYACCGVINILNNRHDRERFTKHFFVKLLVMAPVLVADGVLRGFLSAVMMKLA